MTHIEQAIREAVEKGGYDPVDKSGHGVMGSIFVGENYYSPHLAFLDPLFWQALATARWHRFIDHLAEGKDAESFFENLK